MVADEAAAKEIAAQIGFPLMIKAAEGGGGRGMRVVRRSGELIAAFQTARTEAEQAFGSPNVYMEKLIERPRHIEFQVLGDRHGNVIHLGERECSLQRRHQKVLEESPSTVLDAATRQRIGNQVVEALQKDRVFERRDRGVSARRIGRSLLHRNECADSGGASGDGDGYRRRPGEIADSPGGGRKAG